MRYRYTSLPSQCNRFIENLTSPSTVVGNQGSIVGAPTIDRGMVCDGWPKAVGWNDAAAAIRPTVSVVSPADDAAWDIRLDGVNLTVSGVCHGATSVAVKIGGVSFGTDSAASTGMFSVTASAAAFVGSVSITAHAIGPSGTTVSTPVAITIYDVSLLGWVTDTDEDIDLNTQPVLAGFAGVNWVGVGTGPWVHTPGSTSGLGAAALIALNSYQSVWLLENCTVGSVRQRCGINTDGYKSVNGTYTTSLLVASTTSFNWGPTSDFDGAVTAISCRNHSIASVTPGIRGGAFALQTIAQATPGNMRFESLMSISGHLCTQGDGTADRMVGTLAASAYKAFHGPTGFYLARAVYPDATAVGVEVWVDTCNASPSTPGIYVAYDRAGEDVFLKVSDGSGVWLVESSAPCGRNAVHAVEVFASEATGSSITVDYAAPVTTAAYAGSSAADPAGYGDGAQVNGLAGWATTKFGYEIVQAVVPVASVRNRLRAEVIAWAAIPFMIGDGWSANWTVDVVTKAAAPTVTDAGFDDDAYWTKGANWTVAGSSAVHAAGDTDEIYRSGTCVVGRRYPAVIVLDSCDGLIYQYQGSYGQRIASAGTYSVSMTAGGVRTGLAANTHANCSCPGVTWTCSTSTAATPGVLGASFGGMILADAVDVTRPFVEAWGGVQGLRFDGDTHTSNKAAATENHLHDGTGCTWWRALHVHDYPAVSAALFATCADASGVGVITSIDATGAVVVQVANGTGTFALEATSTARLSTGAQHVLIGRWAAPGNYEVWLDAVRIINAAVVAPSAADASASLREGDVPGGVTLALNVTYYAEGDATARVDDVELVGLADTLCSIVGTTWAVHTPIAPETLSTGASTVISTPAAYDAFGVAYERADGTIYYLYRTGTTHAGDKGDIVARTSADSGTTWSAPSVVFTDATLDCRSGAGGIDSAGRWWFCYFTYDWNDPTNPATTRVYRVYSDDEGATWSAPEYLTSACACYGPLVEWGTLRGVACSVGNPAAGTLALVAWDADGNNRVDRYIRSDEITPGAASYEIALTCLGGNKLLGFSRSAADTQLLRVYSEDGGLTWDLRYCDITLEPLPVGSTCPRWEHVSPWIETRPNGTRALWFCEREDLVPLGYQNSIRTIVFDPYDAMDPTSLPAAVTQYLTSEVGTGYPSRAGDVVCWYDGDTFPDIHSAVVTFA